MKYNYLEPPTPTLSDVAEVCDYLEAQRMYWHALIVKQLYLNANQRALDATKRD
jgi:hypothetical protein